MAYPARVWSPGAREAWEIGGTAWFRELGQDVFMTVFAVVGIAFCFRRVIRRTEDP